MLNFNYDFTSSSNSKTLDVCLTSDNGRHHLTVAASSEDWRSFIPEGFETLSRIRKDYGCGLSLAMIRTVLECGHVPMRELFLLVPSIQSEGGGGEDGRQYGESFPVSPDHEYKLLAPACNSGGGKLTFDRTESCMFMNGVMFSSLNPYVVTTFDKKAAFEYLLSSFMPQVEETRPYTFVHPDIARGGGGQRREGLKLDPAKVFKTFHVDIVKRG